MELPRIIASQSMNLLNHVPVNLGRVQRMIEVKKTENGIGKFSVVTLRCPILGIRNRFIVHMIVTKVEKNAKVSKGDL
jgi:hypothetical protein